MYEKILQKLKGQRGTTSNVTDKSLEDMARSLTVLVVNDEILATLDMSGTIASLDGNINKNTADAVKKTADADAAKKAAEELAKKAIIPTIETPPTGTTVDPVLQAVLDQNKLIMESLNKLQGEKITTSRTSQFDAAIKDFPDIVKNTIKNSFKADNFESDESFAEYLVSVENDKKSFDQQIKEQGLNFSKPPPANHIDPEEVSSEMEAAIKELTTDKTVEQKF